MIKKFQVFCVLLLMAGLFLQAEVQKEQLETAREESANKIELGMPHPSLEEIANQSNYEAVTDDADMGSSKSSGYAPENDQGTGK